VLENHEFLADEGVIEAGLGFENYTLSILKNAASKNYSGMVSTFSLKLTKRRLKMMKNNTDSKKNLFAKIIPIIPALAIAFYVVSCDNSDNAINVEKEHTIEFSTVSKQEANEYMGNTELIETFSMNSYSLSKTVENKQQSFVFKDGMRYLLSYKTDEKLNSEEFYLRFENETDKLSVNSYYCDDTYYVNFDCSRAGVYHLWVATDKVKPGDKVGLISIKFKEGVLMEARNAVNTKSINSEDNDETFSNAEEMPRFMGGDQEKFQAYLKENMNYPESLNGKSGKVYVQFTIETDGSLSGCEIVKGLNTEADKEALRLINLSPKWEPGKQKGEKVPVRITFPVKFNAE